MHHTRQGVAGQLATQTIQQRRYSCQVGSHARHLDAFNGALDLVVSDGVSRRLQYRINRQGAPKRFQTLVGALARSDALLVCQRTLRLGVTRLDRRA